MLRSSQPSLPYRDPLTGQLQGLPPPMKTDANVSVLPEYDIVVIGGGINGTGIARDAAERGFSVLLLEKNDFGAGTSAYSSRLIHGGLRYLENYEFDLVYESLHERERLLRNAPHLVHPLALAIPIYKGGQHTRLLVWLGMVLYDLLSLSKSMPKHQMYHRNTFLEEYPGINADGLLGGAVYYDAQVDFPERLCVESALAAQETQRATLLNHAEVTGITGNATHAHTIRFTDHIAQRSCIATARVIINAAGPWVDDIIQKTSEEKPSTSQPYPKIGGTKGSHIVVAQFADAPATALYVEAESDGRPFFIIPWRKEYYLIGTTDLHYEGSPDQAVATQQEVEYLLRETNRVLPNAHLTKQDVLYAYSGIRPLPYTHHQKEGKITRKHIIADQHKEPDRACQRYISIIGGKLTTYRNLAEEAIDYAVKKLHLTRADGQRVPQSTTRKQSLPGGKGIHNLLRYKQQQAKLPQNTNLSPALLSHLIDLYGSRYRQVLAMTEEKPELLQPLYPGSPDIGAQVIYAVRTEMAQTVSDVLLRRIGCGLNADIGLQSVQPVAEIMGQALQWPPEKVQSEVAAYTSLVQETSLAFRNPQPVH